MITRSIPLLGLLAFGALSGCTTDWNSFERSMDKTFVDDSRFTDLKCNDSGCFLCEDELCEPYACDATDQCPSGFVCTIDRRCLPGSDGASVDVSLGTPSATCAAEEDCQADELCSLAGECVPRGTGTPGQPTSPADSTDGGGDGSVQLPDHPNDACVINADCGDGICLDAACLFPCAADKSCPTGQTCDAGQCLPTGESETLCTFNGECGPGNVCIEGGCFTTCAADAGCGPHESCFGGLCQANTQPVIQCSGAASCEDDASCVDGKCLAACAPEAGCTAGFSCEFGFCQQDVSCLNTAECTGGGVCLDGRCQS